MSTEPASGTGRGTITREDTAQAIDAIGTFIGHLKEHPEHQTPEILDALEHAIDVQKRWLQENGVDTPPTANAHDAPAQTLTGAP
ncbi:hypothetical protein [Arthrobacter sp. UYEF36]|uniref:hypothetical protein n=1 Tax=Arthrobacter sp. UYEF36 TaxID=1756366 RepID=UPI003396E9E4